LATGPARAAGPEAGAEAARLRFAALKALERATLVAPAREEMERLDRLRAALRRAAPAPVRARLMLEPPRDRAEAGGPQGAARGDRVLRAPAASPATTTPPANRMVNDPSLSEVPNAAQSEVALAVRGDELVAAWNDGSGSAVGGDALGVAWSRDGGLNWVAAGEPPRGSVVGVWFSDPTLAVDEKSGTFYLSGMATSVGGRNSVAVAAGHFGATGFAFDPPVLAREAGRDTLPDKPWIAADSLSGELALTYTSFFRLNGVTQSEIEFQRWTPAAGAWSPPLKLSARAEDGMVQGSRPAFGPAGEIVTAWTSIDTTRSAAGADFLRARVSRDGGASFEPANVAAAIHTNFGSGAPGFNRPYGFAFPSLAVDRSGGPYRGRVYMSWNESVDFYRDPLGTGTPFVETSPSSDPASATPAAVGGMLRGTIEAQGDIDFYRLHGPAGQTWTFYLDSLAAGLDLSMRIVCGDGQTLLAYNAPIVLWARVLVFTLPASGDYYLRIAPYNTGTGGYRIASGIHVPGDERARDHRDVFVAASDDAVHWLAPTRVNGDPAGYDDWLPEVTVADDGGVYVAWYDWRDSPALCGGASSIRHARSADGGFTWTEAGPLANRLTNWTLVSSNIAPNQGDYIALAARGGSLFAAWADGRNGNPDVFMARRDLSGESAPQPPAPSPVIRAVRPNPAREGPEVAYEVPHGTPVRIELLDPGGRRWRRIDVDHPGRGLNLADLGPGASLPPGLYFARVTQAGRADAARVVIVR